jgi:hypothetical protein
MGYALADLGRDDEVKTMISELKDADPVSALSLEQYVKKVSPPKILFHDQDLSSFNVGLGPTTPLYALDAYLANASVSKDMTLVLQFNKPMDKFSVQNVNNWRIARSDQLINGLYNNGLPVTSKEVSISPLPASVTYNPVSNQAVIKFTITQNAAVDATIDPRHLIFKFLGVDENGIAMDPKADEFSGETGPV